MTLCKNPCSLNGEPLQFGHLGGTSTTGDRDSWYPEMWSWLIEKFSVKRMFDVGCGVGFAMDFFKKQNVFAYGMDCREVLAHHIWGAEAEGCVAEHDLTRGFCCGWGAKFDLVWCCELAEHVEEQFVNNVIQTVVQNTGKVLAFCAAPNGAGGYHHVNCHDPYYWHLKLEAAGLIYDETLTQQGRALCTEANGRSDQNYFRRSGLIFTRPQRETVAGAGG